MARVVVTGATGCLGRALIAELAARGDHVTAIARQPQDLPGAMLHCRDLASEDVDDLLNGAQIVYHCAALSTAWGSAAAFEAANVTATWRLLCAARGAGVQRFVFASSPTIYADGRHRLNLIENAALPAQFASHYARTKHESEMLVRAADQPGGMRCVAIRPRAIYGAHDRALMPRMIQAMRRGTVPLIAGGQAQIDVTHSHDAARAMILAAERAQKVGGRAFNITSGQSHTVRELVDHAARLTGLRFRTRNLPYGVAIRLATLIEAWQRLRAPETEPVLTRQAVMSMGRSMTLDISAARSELGYAPQVTLEQGLRDYV